MSACVYTCIFMYIYSTTSHLNICICPFLLFWDVLAVGTRGF